MAQRKSVIHGLEDVALDPVIDGDYLKLLAELETDTQNLVVSKAQNILENSI